MNGISVELEMLLFSAILFVVQTLISAVSNTLRNGIGWGLGNRDEETTEGAWEGRAKRAYKNMGESLLPFTCVVLIVQTAGLSGELSALGATVFFYSRISHAIFYLAGIRFLRTLAYFGGLVGMGMIVAQAI